MLSSVYNCFTALLFHSGRGIPPLSIHRRNGDVVAVKTVLAVDNFTDALIDCLFGVCLEDRNKLRSINVCRSKFKLVSGCVKLVFITVDASCCPQLTTIRGRGAGLDSVVGRRAMMSLLVLYPIVAVFLPATPLVIHLLLAGSFLPIVPFLS